MYSRTESHFTGFQDAKLYYQRWIPSSLKGQLIVTHGHGEHSECYQRLADALEGTGWSVFAWDWRGHGRSQGQRGYANEFNDYCYDFESFYNYLHRNEFLDLKIPTVMLGHSMGALIQLRSILAHPEWKIAGQSLSSPMLGVSIEIPPAKKMAAEIVRNILPRLTLSTGITNAHCTRDPDVIREFDHDVLRHDRMCSGVWFGALDAIKYVQERADKFQGPIFLQMPDQDKVVSSSASNVFFEKFKGQKKLKIYPGHYHELFNDLDRAEPLADVRNYLSGFVK